MMVSLYATTYRFSLNRHPVGNHIYGNKTPPDKPRGQIVYSKTSAFQDFQGYANPSRLLPATKPDSCTDSSLQNVLIPLEVEGAECFYKVKLCTSDLYGSDLSDLKAGILLCLVDEKGDSILQRIPAISNKLEEDFYSDIIIHFQRGSIDEFTFRGPKLQKIVAVWIGLESGQWRPGGASVTVTYQNQPSLSGNDENKAQYICNEYTFDIDDTLLGEGCDTSMIELRPCQIKEFIGDDITSLTKNIFQPTSMANDGISKEESMREYADLKFSLLLYDVLLVLSGSSVASFLSGRNSGVAFLAGGTVGFLYLFLLQRSVDRLPAPGSVSGENTGVFGEIFGKFESPVSTLVLAFIFAVIAVKYGSSNSAVVLTPKEVLCVMLGFLVCKVAVVLAAFKTMPIGIKKDK